MYKQRIKIFMGIIAVALAVIIVRLWQLQIGAGEEFRKQVERDIRQEAPLRSGLRGQILDRNGEILAVDKPCHDLCLDYRFLTNDITWVRAQQRKIALQEKVSADRAKKIYAQRAENTRRLAAQSGKVTAEELEAQVRRVVRRVEAIRRHIEDVTGAANVEIKEQRQAHPVITGLDEAATAELKAHLNEMIGSSLQPGYGRYYPHGPLACHIIGVTGQVSAAEQQRLNVTTGQADTLDKVRSKYLGGDPIGKTGVEKMCEAVLRGRRGYRKYKRHVNSLEILEELPPEPGQDVKLTIDHRLQKRLMELFLTETARQNLLSGSRAGDKPGNGAIVVLSVPKGEVLAMVSVPTYDLNRYYADYRLLASDDRHNKVSLPLRNRAVTVLYPPGSTAKPMTALAGLADKAITRDTSFTCEGGFQVGRDRYLHCWTYWRHMSGHGTLSVTEGLKHSCNIFFYNVGSRLGLEALSQWLVCMGFADEPGTGLPEEVAGTVPTAEWLRKRKPDYRPVLVDAMQVAIGQGFFGATPLHVANAMAAIARGGRFQSPLLVKEGWSPGDRSARGLPLDPADLRAVVEGMYGVVNEDGGTAYKVFHAPGVEPLDVDVCGKTGTATAAPADLDGDGQIDEYERDRSEMAWFAGFARPRASAGQAAGEGRQEIAFAVVVEYVKGGGSGNAAPIAREVIRICREMGYIR